MLLQWCICIHKIVFILQAVTSDAVKNVDGDLPHNTETGLTEVDDNESLNDISVQLANSASESESCGTCEDEGGQSYDMESMPSAVLQPNGEFMCSSCGEKMKCARAIKRHVSGHINEELSGTPSTILYRDSADKTHAMAKKQVKQKEVSQRKHLSRLDMSDGSSKEWRSYVCKDCGDKFTTSALLDLHRVQMHRPHKCQKCGSVLIGRRNFSSHVRSEHPGLHICKVIFIALIK